MTWYFIQYPSIPWKHPSWPTRTVTCAAKFIAVPCLEFIHLSSTIDRFVEWLLLEYFVFYYQQKKSICLWRPHMWGVPCCVVPDKDFLGGLLSRMGDFCDRGSPGLKKIVYFPMARLVFKGIIAFLKCTSATSKKWVTSDVTATDSWKYKEKMPLSQCHGLIGSLQLSPV